MKELVIIFIKDKLPALLIGALLVFAAFLMCCSTVEYKKYTGVQKCDMAIMLAKIKSKKGYEAFEVDKYVSACFSELDRESCKKEFFGKDEKISYDKKDERYMNYLSCLGERK